MQTKFKEYQYALNLKQDKERKDYYNFLYPNEYEHQTILNQRVLMNLEKHGDNPELEREIDHWLYFETEEDRNNYILKVEKIGYKVLSTDVMDKGERPYQLNISKVSNAHRNTIDDLVWELITLCKEDNGTYDGWGCPIAQ